MSFQLEQSRKDTKWEVAPLEKQVQEIKRAIHMANFFILTPPSDPEGFAKNRDEVLSLIFAQTPVYLSHP
jgi:hypothetical protein